jgi:hypothetical protein
MTEVTRLGQCALCQRDGEDLQDSHFLPAAAYRVTRDETEYNPNPITFSDDGVFQSSRQISDHLLCRECEQRLSKNGEQWFFAHCWRKSRFLLASLLEGASPVHSSPRIKVYHAAMIAKLNVAALAYFAASMFWRASAHQWKMAGMESKGIDLGPYEEQLRLYLLDATPFPENCVLWISVPENISAFVHLSLTPYGGRKDNYRVYKLIVLGIGFHLLVGSQIPNEARLMCSVRGVRNPIYRTDMLEEGAIQDIHTKFSLHPQLLDGPGRKRAR